MLDEIQIKLDDLLLDPNNPRFKRNLTEDEFVADNLIESKQNSVLKMFKRNTATNNKDDVTDITVLYDSIRTIGFVPIDRIVVRPIAGSDKFLVIEGNRRISTIKTILHDYENRLDIFDNTTERNKCEEHFKTFTNITCMLLETKGLSQEIITNKISIILGLRHHGALLEWEALPKAYNIFKEYMNIEPKLDSFAFENGRRNSVSNMLSISKQKVTASIKTYVVYLQLCEHFNVKARLYSLIQACATNKNLDGTLFNIDKSTYRLDEESLDNFNNVCQFSNRDNLPKNKKKILETPQNVRLLGNLFDKKQKAKHQTIKSYADDLIRRAMDEDDTDMPLETAVSDLTDFEKRTFWVDTVKDLLKKQEDELNIIDYTGVGNDLGKKEELKITLEPLRRIMGV